MKKTLLTLLVGAMALTASAESDGVAEYHYYGHIDNAASATNDKDAANPVEVDYEIISYSDCSTLKVITKVTGLSNYTGIDWQFYANDCTSDFQSFAATDGESSVTMTSKDKFTMGSTVPGARFRFCAQGTGEINTWLTSYKYGDDNSSENGGSGDSGETGEGGDNGEGETGETWESHYYGDITTTANNQDLTIHYELISDSKCEALTINATFDGEENFESVVREFYIGSQFETLSATTGKYAYSGTLKKTFTKGEDLSGAYFRFAYAGGVVTPNITYAYGDDNSSENGGSGDSGETGEDGDNGEGETGDTWESHYYGDITTKVVTDNDLTIHYELIADSKCEALTINATFEGEEKFDGVVREFYYGGQHATFSATTGEYAYSGTLKKTFTKGEDLSGAYFRFAVTGGEATPHLTCAYGDDNSSEYEKPVVEVKPTLTAEVTEFTANSAKITYNVTLPADIANASVKVYLDETEATESPIALTGLEANKEYSYKLKAVATLDDTEYTSDEVEVLFTTLAADAKEAVWHTIVDGLLPNIYLTTEDASQARNIPFSCPVKVTYNLNKTITTEITLQGSNKKVVGLVPKVGYNSDVLEMEKKDNGVYSKTSTAQYASDTELTDFFLEMAYSGSVAKIYINDYKVGLVGDEVTYGSAKEMTLSTTATNLKIGDAIPVYAAVKDENGHYLIDAAVTYSFENAREDKNVLNYTDGKFTANDKGDATITGTCGDATATLPITVYAHAESVNIEPTYSAPDAGTPGNAFDGNMNTYLTWKCGTTETHSIYLAVGDATKENGKMVIEGVHLVWKGDAFPTSYTITLSENKPEGWTNTGNESADNVEGEETTQRRVTKHSDDNGTYTMTNDASVATADGNIYNDFLVDDSGVDTANYITITTNSAYNASNGIKLASISLQGLPADSDVITGVDTILSEENAPVEFYTLSGIRVKGTPAAGLYIRRQGSKATKVLVK
jgi:hypothetical protein